MDARRITALRGRLCDTDARIAWVLEHSAGVDDRIGLLATLQHGIVTWSQLLRLGTTEKAILHRLTSGRLHKLHRGVYAVGHEALTDESRWSAAVLAVEPGALSHFASGAAWRFIPTGGLIHVTSNHRRRPRRGLTIHHAELPETDLAIVDGIVLTTVERTLLDLGALASEARLRSWVREAKFLGLTDAGRLTAVLDRHPRRRGRRNLGRVVDQTFFGRGVTHGELEHRFIDFLQERGLPEPELNVEVRVDRRRFVLDCLWRDARLVVELDGRPAHTEGERHDRDTLRDRKLLLVGLETIRVTWRHLAEAPDDLERDLRAALARRERQFTGLHGR